MVTIVTGDPRPIFRQIVDGLSLQIASGELPPGTKLPSVRSLALQLAINPNTVAKAYAELVNRGAILSQRGVGVYVAEQRQRLSLEERQTQLTGAVERFVGEVIPLGFSPSEVAGEVRRQLEALRPEGHHPKHREAQDGR